MKHIKKVVSFFMTAILTFMFMNVSAFTLMGYAADSDFIVDSYGNLISYEGTDTIITLPSTVKNIVSAAFRYKLVTEVTIPDTVTQIGNEAFADCKYLTGITINGNNLTTVGDSVFYNCEKLESFVFPNSVTSLGANTFVNCKSLKSAVLPSKITTIPAQTFYGCHKLDTITYPETYTKIGDKAFYQCYELKSITIPNGVNSIGEAAFRYCTGLTSIDLSSNTAISSISSFAFANSGVESIKLSSNINKIENHAFFGCGNLASIDLGSTITSIGTLAFYNNDENFVINCPSGSAAEAYAIANSIDYNLTDPVKVSSISFTDNEVDLLVGETFTMSATVLPDNADNKALEWSSDNTAVATVDSETGEVTAVSAGVANIKATAKDDSGINKSYKVTVSVPAVAVDSVLLNYNTLTLTAGETSKLIATVLPDNASSKTVTWKSSDDATVFVDNDGNLTALKAGSAIITAKAGGKSATCTVTVNKAVVTSVIINPDATTVQKGTSKQFEAVLSGNGEYDDTVIWSVEGGVAQTIVSDTGLLYIALDETADSLIVKASAENGTLTATAVVTVTDVPVEQYSLTVKYGTGSGDYAVGDKVTIIADLPDEGKCFSNWKVISDISVVLADANLSVTTFTMPACDVTIEAIYKDVTPDPDPSIVLGDTNGDGVVDIQDVVITRAGIVGNRELTEEEIKRADVNGDENIDIQDIVKIRAIIVSK